MNSWQIRSWLLQTPKPSRVRLTMADEETKELDCRNRPAVRIADSISAIGPELIEALGPEGELLRAMRPRGVEESGTGAPPIPGPIAADPQAVLLSHFASLIHRSYEHSTELAFGKLIELVERMGERSDAIERRLERAEAAYRREQSERIDDLWDRAEEVAASGGSKDDILKALLTSMMQGQQHRQQAAAAAAAPKNGGGKAE